MKIKDADKLSKEILSKYHITFFRSRYDGHEEIINCLGSGTLIMLDQVAYILTAAHVIRELEYIRKGGGENGLIGMNSHHSGVGN